MFPSLFIIIYLFWWIISLWWLHYNVFRVVSVLGKIQSEPQKKFYNCTSVNSTYLDMCFFFYLSYQEGTLYIFEETFFSSKIIKTPQYYDFHFVNFQTISTQKSLILLHWVIQLSTSHMHSEHDPTKGIWQMF